MLMGTDQMPEGEVTHQRINTLIRQGQVTAVAHPQADLLAKTGGVHVLSRADNRLFVMVITGNAGGRHVQQAFDEQRAAATHQIEEGIIRRGLRQGDHRMGHRRIERAFPVANSPVPRCQRSR